MVHGWIHRVACVALWLGVCMPWAQAQTASGSRITNGVLVIDGERSVPLPQQDGTWTVAYSQPVARMQSPVYLVGLVHSDPNSPVPMVVVRYSERATSWRGSVCETTSTSVFMTEYYGTQTSGNSQRCSMVFPIGSLRGFERTTQSNMWQPAFQGGLGSGSLPDTAYLLTSWRMQEFGRHNLIVEAMVRVDLMNTSGAEMAQAYRINQLNPVHTAIKEWLRSAVTQTAEAYFNGAQSTIAVLDTTQVRQSMQAAVSAPREDFAASPVIGTSMGQTQPTNTVDVFDAERWRSPVDIETGVISMPSAYANSAATVFEVAALEPVRAPGDGKLLYRGPMEGQESGFVIDHGKGLYSVLSSDMNWNLRAGPELGQPVEQGQFLVGAATASERALLRWDVFFVPKALSSSDASVWLDVRAGQALHTRLLAGIGLVLFTVDGDRDGITLAVDGRELPRDRSFDTLFLFKASRLPLQVTSGTLFKSVNKDDMLLSARGVLTQVVGKKGNSGYAARMSNFVAVDVAGTETVMARLRGDAPASEVAQTPAAAPVVATAPAAPAPAPAPAGPSAAGPSAAELAERQRLQALAAQREQELERLREQLAQAEAQRQADAQRAAEAQRVAEARAAEAVRLAEAQRAAEQQRQADAQAQALRQQAAQQQAQAEQQAKQAQEARQQALAQQAAQQQAQQARQAEQAAEAQRVAVLNTGKRKALVIGNDVYRSVPKLENARADARAMGQSLEALGFKVTMAMDQTERGMKETLRSFKSKVEGGDEVVVFYAGHGVQLGSTNYLLPVDIAGQDEEQVRDEAIQMQRILDDMQERRTGFMLMIVDACRDNPFKVAGRSIGGRGLAPTSAATGQMVIFSAGAGQQALDKLGATDKEPNGLFTRLFLREMKKPGVSVDRVLRSVRSEVARLARTVGHEQTPALYDQSLGDFFFKP